MAFAPGAEAPWFPVAPVLGERLTHALVALDEQARLLDDLIAACAVGAATLPPALLAAVQAARVAVIAAHDTGALPFAGGVAPL